MTTDHERIEELLAGAALDALDPADERELARLRAAHGAGCAQCRDLERELAEVAGLLAFSLDPVPADRTVAERVLVAAGAGGTSAPRDPASASTDDLAARRVRRDAPTRRGWSALVAVAAALAVVVVVVATVVRPSVEVTRAQAVQTIVRFDAADGVDGTLTMAYTPGEPGAVFWGTDLPDPGEGSVYEIWMIDDGTPISGGCGSPVEGRLALYVDVEVGSTEQMAVTVEPEACPAAPSGDVVLSAPLPTA